MPMSHLDSPIRLLITHWEADEAVLVLARGLAQLPDFEVYLTSEEDYQRAKSSPVGANIIFVGQRPETMRYMAGTDVYVQPSWRDTSPRVVREAMSLSLPTIVSDIPRSRDLVLPNETGLLVPPKDASALALCSSGCWSTQRSLAPESKRVGIA